MSCTWTKEEGDLGANWIGEWGGGLTLRCLPAVLDLGPPASSASVNLEKQLILEQRTGEFIDKETENNRKKYFYLVY